MTLNLDPTSLKLFTSIVDCQSIAQASRLHNIAASAVSKRLAELEEVIGAPLVRRLRSGIEPTPAGMALYGHVKLLSRQIEKMEAELSEYSGGARGRIKLWANTSAITQFLPEDLKLFLDQSPDIRIDLREDTSARIVEAVRDGSADLGIVSDHVDLADLEARLYRRDTLVVFVPRTHPLAGRETVCLADTAAYDHVGLQEGSSLQARVSAEIGRSDFDIRFRVQVFGFEGVRRMVEAGLGIAIMPLGTVSSYLDDGAFVAVKLDEPWAARTLNICCRSFAGLPVATRSLVDALSPGGL